MTVAATAATAAAPAGNNSRFGAFVEAPAFGWGFFRLRMKLRIGILGVLIALALLLLAGAHARWLVTGPQDPRFVRFLRRHARRANAEAILPPRGTAVDRQGQPLTVAGSTFQLVLDDLALAAHGGPVPLTLDAHLQAVAETALKNRRGAVVALEPATGRLRALVSTPRDDALNRALNGLYPPGSTFKIFIAAAALGAGLDPLFDCPAAGYRSARNTPAIRDVEARQRARRGKPWRGFGRLGLDAAFIHSSNTYFAQLGVALGPAAFARAVAVARLRDPVVVLPAASVALESAGGGVPEGLRAPELAPVAIGQGALQLTPLAVALFTAAIANDGVSVAPTLDPAARPALRAQPFTYAAAARVKAMMRAAVQRGTGRACDLPGLDVCGKTGTAETGRGGRDHAWFTCFAPAAAPRLVVTVLVEDGGFGAEAALPVARAVLLAAKEEGVFE